MVINSESPATESQETTTENTTITNTVSKSEPITESIDWSSVTLPDDHPVIKTLNVLKDKVKEYEANYRGVDPQEYQTLKAAKEQAEREKLQTEGKWKELLESNVNDVKSQYESQLSDTQTQLQSLQTERDQLLSQNQQLAQELNNLYKERSLRSLLATVDFEFDEDNWKLFNLDFAPQFEYADKKLKAKKDGKQIDPRELALEIINSKPRFKKQPNGSGATPSTVASKVYDPKGSDKIKLPASFKTQPIRSELINRGINPKDLNSMIAAGKIEWV